MSMKRNLLFTIAVATLSLATSVFAGELEKHQFLKVSPQEQKAVVKTPDGKLQLVGVGENVAGARIIEIVEGRVVLEEQGEEGPQTVIFRLDGKHQRFERILPRGEKAPVLLVPGNGWPKAVSLGEN